MKYLLLTFISFIFLVEGCSFYLFKNDESTPKGYDKFNFSPNNNPTELIRDSLDISISTIQDAEQIFFPKSTDLNEQIANYIKDNNLLKSILNEKSFASFILFLPSFPKADELTNARKNSVESFVANALPENSFDTNYEMDEFFLLKKYSSKIEDDDSVKIEIINTDGTVIDPNLKIDASISTRIYYSRNLYESIKFPLPTSTNTEPPKSTWEFIIQCAQANLTDTNGNQYVSDAWPRITILQTNSATTKTDRYVIIKNTLIYNSSLGFYFLPSTNFSQNTRRMFYVNSNGLPPNSTINNTLTHFKLPNSKGQSYLYFQDGMSSFFSRFSSLIIDNNKAFNSLISWQTAVNKSWFEVSRDLNSDNTIPDYTKNFQIMYLNKNNNYVDKSYSRDFQQRGIHFIDVTKPENILLTFPKTKDAQYIGLTDTFLSNACKKIMHL